MMGGMECLLTGVGDLIEKPLRRFKHVRELLTVCVIVLAFFMSSILCTSGGMYVWNLLNNFSAGLSIIVVAFAQAIAVSWFYGLDEFCKDIKDNLGFSPGIYWRICWKFVSPVFILVIIVFNFILLLDPTSFLYFYKYTEYHPELFANRTVDNKYFYFYPTSGKLAGWGICGIQLIMIPIMAIFALVHYKGLAKAITPIRDHALVNSGHVTRYSLRHWLSLGPWDTFPLDLIGKAWSGGARGPSAQPDGNSHPGSDGYPMTGRKSPADESAD